MPFWSIMMSFCPLRMNSGYMGATSVAAANMLPDELLVPSSDMRDAE